MTRSIRAGELEVTLTGDLQGFEATLSTQELQTGLHEVTVTLTAPAPAKPPAVKLGWMLPAIDIGAMWTTAADRRRGLNVDWGQPMTANSTSHAPVICLHSFDGTNRLTFACSDAMTPTKLMAGIVEESAEFTCSVGLLHELHPQIDRYSATIRIDTRPINYAESLGEVSDWWASLPGYAPAPVPDVARLPMYSTWYSFHQNIDTARILDQCRLAKGMGCEAVIVDDGWQTTDSARGYAYCGDWEPVRVPHMKQFVADVQAIGMKFLLWYSVPFVGKHTAAFERFKGKYLYHNDRLGASTLDPRLPEVREYLIGIYERHLREWNLDGFKLDFVDSFHPTEETVGLTGGGRDYDSVYEAADRLLSDVITRLRAIKPDIMVEFRQSYVGPLMRKYGNLFRAGDCPNDAMANRIRTIDIRLLSGNTAAHADMMMWHPGEPTESAALQLLNVLFSVPQVSVLLDRVPADHVAMLRFWLAFWREHRDVLLDGRLLPAHPESLYPHVVARTTEKTIVAIYDDTVADVPANDAGQSFIINATRGSRVVVRLERSLGERTVESRDCRGNVVASERKRLDRGIHELAIPAAGLGTIR